MITLTVNGKRCDLSGPTLLPDFLKANQVKTTMIAIGLNGRVVHREHWDDVRLNDGDTVDIVEMVGGG